MNKMELRPRFEDFLKWNCEKCPAWRFLTLAGGEEKKNGAEIYTARRTEQKQQNIVIYEFRPNLPCWPRSDKTCRSIVPILYF